MLYCRTPVTSEHLSNFQNLIHFESVSSVNRLVAGEKKNQEWVFME